MKAKFIKHHNPRKTLGLDPLERRNFSSFKEFLDWLYYYVVPNFYNMDNGPKLWNKIINNTGKGLYLPQDLFNYLLNNIIFECKIGKDKGANDYAWLSEISNKYKKSEGSIHKT